MCNGAQSADKKSSHIKKKEENVKKEGREGERCAGQKGRRSRGGLQDARLHRTQIKAHSLNRATGATGGDEVSTKGGRK